MRQVMKPPRGPAPCEGAPGNGKLGARPRKAGRAQRLGPRSLVWQRGRLVVCPRSAAPIIIFRSPEALCGGGLAAMSLRGNIVIKTEGV